MTIKDFFEFCENTYNTLPDYPFEDDFETAVLRHSDTRKWFCIYMRVPRKKLSGASDEMIDIINVKMPIEMTGSFSSSEGVYPAYHMNKLHWVSIILADAPDEVVKFLINSSFEATRAHKAKRRN